MISFEQIKRYAGLPLVVESELGRRMLPMRDVVALAPGSIIKLQAVSGANVSVLVGGAPFATGEVIRIGKAPGVRLVSFGNKNSD